MMDIFRNRYDEVTTLIVLEIVFHVGPIYKHIIQMFQIYNS